MVSESEGLPRRLRIAGLWLLASLVIVVAIELGLRLAAVPDYLIPPPSRVLAVLGNRLPYLLTATTVTALEALVGFILGNTVAYALAVLLVAYPELRGPGMASAIAVKATPVVALAPLFIIWFGNGLLGKCLMAAVVCFFPMLVNAVAGLERADVEAIDYLRSLGASRWQIVRRVRMPNSVPFAVAAAKTSTTISLAGAIVAELSGADQGAGHVLIVAVYQVQTDLMFATILLLAVTGMLFYGAIAKVENTLRGHGWNLSTA